jgi:hypothetical protein
MAIPSILRSLKRRQKPVAFSSQRATVFHVILFTREIQGSIMEGKITESKSGAKSGGESQSAGGSAQPNFTTIKDGSIIPEVNVVQPHRP